MSTTRLAAIKHKSGAQVLYLNMSNLPPGAKGKPSFSATIEGFGEIQLGLTRNEKPKITIPNLIRIFLKDPAERPTEKDTGVLERSVTWGNIRPIHAQNEDQNLYLWVKAVHPEKVVLVLVPWKLFLAYVEDLGWKKLGLSDFNSTQVALRAFDLQKDSNMTTLEAVNLALTELEGSLENYYQYVAKKNTPVTGD